jgi:3,4-dihydroxy-2-butanone 4-phosphate synthase
MDKNARLYSAAVHLYEAAVILDVVNPNLKAELLEKAEQLTKEIKIDQNEINEVYEYKERIKKL